MSDRITREITTDRSQQAPDKWTQRLGNLDIY